MPHGAVLRTTHRAASFAVGVLGIMRPAIWVAVIVPFYFGYILATKRLIPLGCFPLDVGTCLSANWRMIVVLTVMGSMCWLFTFAINDIYDLPADRQNPRRQRSPLVTGVISVRAAWAVVAASALVAIITAVLCGTTFVVITVVWLLIGYAYSAPPLRLKNRGGWDVLSCTIAVGAMPPMLGWATAQPITSMHWAVPVLGVSSMVAVYLPTTIADYETDVRNGVRTVAVKFGCARVYWFGFTANIVVFTLSTYLDVTDSIVPRRMLPIQVVGGLLMIALYHFLLHGQRDQRAIFRALAVYGACAVAFFAVFGIVYVGLV